MKVGLFAKDTYLGHEKIKIGEMILLISYLLCSKYKVLNRYDIEMVTSESDCKCCIDLLGDAPATIYIKLNEFIKDKAFTLNREKYIDLFNDHFGKWDNYYDEGLSKSLQSLVTRYSYNRLIGTGSGSLEELNTMMNSDIDAYMIIGLIVDRKCHGSITKLIFPAKIVETFLSATRKSKNKQLMDKDVILTQYYDAINLAFRIKDYNFLDGSDVLHVSDGILDSIMYAISMTHDSSNDAVYYTIKELLQDYFIYSCKYGFGDKPNYVYTTLSTDKLRSQHSLTIEKVLWEEYKNKLSVKQATYENMEKKHYTYDSYTYYRTEFKRKGKGK